jgi:hypothetical protein
MENLNKEDIYDVSTENFIGYIFVEDSETYFYGVDKNSGIGLVVEGFGSVEDVFDVVKNSDISLRAFEMHDIESESNVLEAYDESTICELTNNLMIALADIDTYEVVQRYVTENVSCYASSKDAGINKEDRIAIGEDGDDSYMLDDSWRMTSGEYFAVGKMNGLTITFTPTFDTNGEYVYIIKDGLINQFVGGTETLAKEENKALLGAVDCYEEGHFTLWSEAYEGSPITIFLLVSDQTDYQVFAQFGGRNLTKT